MSGRPHIKITESVEDLREILKQQKRILAYKKVQMLYLFQSKQVETVRGVSTVLGKSEATIHRWLFQYIAFLRKMRYNITNLNGVKNREPQNVIQL